jgi:hypothetical protein
VKWVAREMEETFISETSGKFQRSTRRYIPEDIHQEQSSEDPNATAY